MKFRKSISLYTALIMLVSMFSPFGALSTASAAGENHVIFAMNFDEADVDATPAPQVGQAVIEAGSGTAVAFKAPENVDGHNTNAAYFPGGGSKTNPTWIEAKNGDGNPLFSGIDGAVVSMWILPEDVGSNTSWLYSVTNAGDGQFEGAAVASQREYIAAFITSGKLLRCERGAATNSTSYFIEKAYPEETNGHRIDIIEGENIQEVYVDGNLFMEGGTNKTISQILGEKGSRNQSCFKIGYIGWGETFKGYIDDVVVYDVAPNVNLGMTEISDESVALPTPAADAGYTVKWSAEGSSPISIDENGYDATITKHETDTDVKLTATITIGEGDGDTYKRELTKDFTVKVKGTTKYAAEVDTGSNDYLEIDGAESEFLEAAPVTVNVKGAVPAGQYIKSVKATQADGEETVTATKIGLKKYTFNMPAYNVKVSAELANIPDNLKEKLTDTNKKFDATQAEDAGKLTTMGFTANDDADLSTPDVKHASVMANKNTQTTPVTFNGTDGYGKNADWFMVEFVPSSFGKGKPGFNDMWFTDMDGTARYGFCYAAHDDGFFSGAGERNAPGKSTDRLANHTGTTPVSSNITSFTYTDDADVCHILVENGTDGYTVKMYKNYELIVTESYSGKFNGINKLGMFTATGSNDLPVSFGNLKIYSDIPHEGTPNIEIDYENEKLTGFDEGGSYTINEEEVSPDASTHTLSVTEYIPTENTETLSIVKKGSEGTTKDSAAQSLVVPARPAAPATVTGEAPTAEGGKGKLKNTTDGMQYREKTDGTGGTWMDCTASETEVVAGKTYEVRTKATATAFASAAADVEVGAYVAPEPPDEYPTRLFYANFDENEIKAVKGKITNQGVTVAEDNGNKVASFDGSHYMEIAKDDGTPLLNGTETAAIHIKAKPANTTADWYFYAAPDATSQTDRTKTGGTKEMYIGAANIDGVLNLERYKGGREGMPAVKSTLAKDAWHDLDFLFNEDTMEAYIDGKFVGSQTYTGAKLSEILGTADTQVFYIGKANWGTGEYLKGMVDDISVYSIAPIVDIENKSITDLLTLPTVDADAGYTVEWTSDKPEVIKIENGAATVKQPAADTAVKLTAKITYGAGINISKDITVTVQGQTALKVTVDEAVQDNITVDKTEAHLGDEINVTVTAPDGKVIKDVKAGDTSILTSGRHGAYKFTMPSSDVKVTVEFEEKKQTAVFHFEDGTADGITYVQEGSAGTMEFADGKTDKALKLTPSAKNGWYGTLDKFPLSLSFSVGAWIKPADMDNWWQRVFDFGTGEGNSIFVTTRGETPNAKSEGTYRVDAFGAGIDSPTKLTVNEWAYITVTYDEATDKVTLYLNGESVGMHQKYG